MYIKCKYQLASQRSSSSWPGLPYVQAASSTAAPHREQLAPAGQGDVPQERGVAQEDRKQALLPAAPPQHVP